MKENGLKKLVKYYHENKLSHAYLLETNNLDKCFADLIQVIKEINSSLEYQDNCSKCNICNLINNGFLPSLIVVDPIGNTIKKEQILELKNNFSTMPIYTKNNIYVIKLAEKLNGASANTMLKFLEEPEDNIIGFFITLNINNVLSTITSRCEVLKIYYDIDNTIEDKEKYDVALEYLSKLEVEKKDFIMYNKDILLNRFSEKEDIKIIFKIILTIYQQLFAGIPVKGLELKLEKKVLMSRINKVVEFLDNIESNVNLQLLLDKFVIELGEEK